MNSNTQSTNFRGGLSAQDTVTGKQLYLTGTNTGSGFALNINGGGSGGGGTQYTDGTIAPSHPIGNALTYSNGTNMVAVSSSNPLPTTATLSASSLAINDGTTTSRKASVLALTDSNPLTVAIVNSNGDQITSFGGGTQYAELTTTSPATGTAILGRYLSAPSGGLTNGQMSMPLLDNYGQLKVVPVGSITTNPTTDPVNTTGSITVQDSSSTTTTSGSYQGVGIITGTPTTGSAVSRTISGFSSIRIMVTGTWTGTLSLEKSSDGGTTWTTSVWKVQGSAYNTGTTTGNGMFDTSAGAATNVRIRATTAMTGTASVVIQPGYGIESVNIVNPIRIYDNTSGSSVTVKIASTASIATDTSLVVGLSPNSPLPAGSNTIGAITNTSFGATQSGAWNITNISGTVSLPTGAATAANQTTMAANQTNGTQQTKITDGTNIANVLASGTPNSTGSAVLTAGMLMPVTFSTTSVASVASTDAGNYPWVSVYIATQGTSSSIAFQTSNDNTNWTSQFLFLITSNNSAGASSTTSTGMYVGAVQGRYFRLNVTGISAGTTAGTVQFYSTARETASHNVVATQVGTWVQRLQDGTGNAITSVNGSLNVLQSAATGALTQVASSATSVTVLASNTSRKGATFYNNSTAILYLAFSSTASTTAFTVPLASGTFFEMPSGYNGVVSGIWATANGNVEVTEIT